MWVPFPFFWDDCMDNIPFVLRDDFLSNGFHLGMFLWTEDERFPFSCYCNLFSCDVRNCTPEKSLVVQVDCGQSRSNYVFVSNDVCRIKPTTHSDLDDGNIDLSFFKNQKSDRGEKLEAAGTDIVCSVHVLHAYSCVSIRRL